MNIRSLLRQPVLTVAIHDLDARWTLGRAGRIQSCGRVPLPPGMVDDGVIVDCEATARVLREGRFPGSARMQVICGLPSQRTVLRQIDAPPLKGKQFGELVGREIRRELPVLAENAHISWQDAGERNGKRRVLVIGVARDVLDSHVSTLRLLGLHPVAADLRVIAAARAVGDADAIIANVEDDEIEIAIFRDGLPLIVRYVAMSAPCGDERWSDQLIEELARTLKFFRDSNKDEGALTGVPISFVGAAARSAMMIERLRASVEHDVALPALRIDVRPESEGARFAGNIGLALKELAA